jgi:hypothetical protein
MYDIMYMNFHHPVKVELYKDEFENDLHLYQWLMPHNREEH